MKLLRTARLVLLLSGSLPLLPALTHGDAVVVAPGLTEIAGKLIVSAWMPAANDKGQIAFHGRYFDGAQSRIGLFTPDALLVQTGDIIDGKIIEGNPQLVSEGLNDAGVLAVMAQFRDQDQRLAAVTGRGLFTVNLDTGERRLVLQTGDTVGGRTLEQLQEAAFNDEETLVFVGRDTDGVNGLFSYNLVSGEGGVIVTIGSGVDDGTLQSIGEIGLNDAGGLLIKGWLTNGSHPGIFEMPKFFLQRGDVIDSKTIQSIGCPSVNDLGSEIFWATFDGGGDSGILDRNSLLIQQGDVIAGETLTFVGCGCINNLGDIVFEGSYTAGDGIFKLPGNGDPGTLVVGPGAEIAGKVITSAWMPAANGLGQIAFHGRYLDGAQSRIGLFTPDALLVQTGDVIDGKIIEGNPQLVSDGLNDAGVLAVMAQFRDQDQRLAATTGRGLFTVNLNTGERQLVLQTGDTVGGRTLEQLQEAAFNDAETLLFVGRDTNGVNGLFSHNLVSGEGSVLVTSGSRVDEGTLGTIGEIGFNDTGGLLIKGWLEDGSHPGIFELPEFFLQRGDVIDSKTIQSIGCPSANDLGSEIFWATFDGGADSGILDRNSLLIQQGDVVAGETLTFVGCGCINNLGDIIFEGSYAAGDGIFLLEGPDVDADGVSDTVEDNAPNGGDGNGDGIQDSAQINVASLPNSEDQQFVSLASPGGSVLEDVVAAENPSPGDTPAEAEFPIGFLDFSVNALPNGGATTVEIFIPEGTVVNQYLKYGPEPGNVTPHWYTFAFDGTTGAEFFADKIVLHFVDGQRGDDDLTANGVVVDPGAPAFLPDADGDGLENEDDQCPNSDLRPTVIIAGNDSGVPNHWFPGGCTIADLIIEIAAEAENHGEFVSAVSALANQLKSDGLISGAEKGAIQKAAANADLP